MRGLLIVLALFAGTATARTIHWPDVHVIARLDARGRLHVHEEQRTVFDGDWIGGERVFRLRGDQSVTIDRMLRLDHRGREIDLQRGELDRVDRYELLDGHILRWRNRLATDPPFENRGITCVVEYTIENAVTRLSSDSARLDYDFLAANRKGTVENFTLRLTFEPAWDAREVNFRRGPIPPGRTAIVAQEIGWLGEGRMPATGIAPSSLALVIALLLGGIASFLILRVRRRTHRAFPVSISSPPVRRAGEGELE